MNTIDTIIRELEKIPEPMQLSVLKFIRSLDNNNLETDIKESGSESEGKRYYPLREMPIQIEPDFDEPMTDMWTALFFG
jgi:hypothetical protein